MLSTLPAKFIRAKISFVKFPVRVRFDSFIDAHAGVHCQQCRPNLTAIKIFQALFINVTMSDPRYRHGAEHQTHAANDDGEEGSRTCTTQHCSNHL